MTHYQTPLSAIATYAEAMKLWNRQIYAEAIAQLRTAVLLGSGEASFQLARAHEEGLGVERSNTQAQNFYGIAAQRNVPSQQTLSPSATV